MDRLSLLDRLFPDRLQSAAFAAGALPAEAASTPNSGNQKERGSRVITMIHRQKTRSLFSVPISRMILPEDAQQVTPAIQVHPQTRLNRCQGESR